MPGINTRGTPLFFNVFGVGVADPVLSGTPEIAQRFSAGNGATIVKVPSGTKELCGTPGQLCLIANRREKPALPAADWFSHAWNIRCDSIAKEATGITHWRSDEPQMDADERR